MTNHVKLCDKNWWSIKNTLSFFTIAIPQHWCKIHLWHWLFLLSSFQSFERFATNFKENQPLGVYCLFKRPFANLVRSTYNVMQMITTLEMAFRSKVKLYSMLQSINKQESKELDFRNSLAARRKFKRKNISLLYWNLLKTKQITMQFCFVVNSIMCFYPMWLWRSNQAHYRLKWKMIQCLSIITTAYIKKMYTCFIEEHWHLVFQYPKLRYIDYDVKGR